MNNSKDYAGRELVERVETLLQTSLQPWQRVTLGQWLTDAQQSSIPTPPATPAERLAGVLGLRAETVQAGSLRLEVIPGRRHMARAEWRGAATMPLQRLVEVLDENEGEIRL